MANRVIHFEIQADEPARAQAFYEKTFGWKVEQMMSKEKGGMMDYWSLTTGANGTPGINGGMYQRTDAPLHTYDCTIEVADIDAAVEAVKTNGGTITREKGEIPGVGWFVSALDTEGNKVGLMQPTEWQAK